MKVVYIDTIAGASGDMLLGALIDAGVDQAALAEKLAGLGLDEASLTVKEVLKNGFSAKKVDVMVDYDGNPVKAEDVDKLQKLHCHCHDHGHSHDHNHGHDHSHDHSHGEDHNHSHDDEHGHSHEGHDHEHSHSHSHSHDHGDHDHHHGPARSFSDIVKIIEDSSLEDRIKQKSIACLRLIGEAEAKIHAQPIEQIHLHEVGGVDAIMDVVGVIVGFEMLGADKIVCSPLPVGRGFVTGAHGEIPLPAPAAALIMEEMPLYGVDIDKELVTPTGAALIKFLADEYGAMPAMKLTGQGCGAGTRDLVIPNILRLFIGQTDSSVEQLVMLEADIDDMSPEQAGRSIAKLTQAGALDVTVLSVQMKKQRPGMRISALVDEKHALAVRGAFFRETSTFGIRESVVNRHALERKVIEVKTVYGSVRVKQGFYEGELIKQSPEYDDCEAAAEASGVTWREVYEVTIKSILGNE